MNIPVDFLDFETQSACNLKQHGAYVYAEHPSTKVLCATIWEKGSCEFIFWTPHEYPGLVMPTIMDTPVRYEFGIQFFINRYKERRRVEAQNHGFERAIWTRTFPQYNNGQPVPEPAEWGDTMDILLSRGLPAGLDQSGSYLFGMPKDLVGLNRLRSIWGPNKKTGIVPVPTTADIQAIIEYNARDVIVSAAVEHRFGAYMTPESEEKVRRLHHKINHRGLYIDQAFARTLRDWDEVFKVAAAKEVEEVTGGEIKRCDLTRREFLRGKLNEKLPRHLYLQNMQASSLEKLIDPEETDPEEIDPDIVTVIKDYLVFSRAALAKVEKALNVVAADGKAHAQFRYWGASTGRWSGYDVQVQNLKRPHEDFDLKGVVKLIEERCAEMAAGRWSPEMDAAMLEDFKAYCTDKKGVAFPPYELLGSLIRGIIAPEPGYVFVVGDFAQVEARAVLYLAGDMEGLKEHRASDHGGPDVYCVLASSMYGRTITKAEKTPRQGGKIGVLACFGENTEVVTYAGVKNIVDVNSQDRVWDGVKWVSTDGVVCQGSKLSLDWCGVRVTPDQLVLVEDAPGGWVSVSNITKLQEERALRLGGTFSPVSHDIDDIFKADVKPEERPGFSMVYDLANCGPHNRFTILTNKGPVIVHNCGYAGGPNAVSRMATGMGIDLQALGITPQFVVDGYRNKYPMVVKFWGDCEYAFRRVLTSNRESTCKVGMCEFRKLPDCVQIILPSGRPLTYTNARIIDDPWGNRDRDGHLRQVIAYDTAMNGKVVTHTLYGGKISQHITQAFCRDLLADRMVATDDAGMDIDMHCHDEEVCAVPIADADDAIKFLEKTLREVPAWATGFPLFSNPEIMTRYGK